MAGNAGLFDDPNAGEGPEEDAPSPFSLAVEVATEALGGKRKGRPAGARNRKSESFEKWFYARGFKDPAVYLAELYSADPMALREAVNFKAGAKQSASLFDIVNLQRAAAAELMPYLHGKKPIDVVVTHENLPMLILRGDLDQVDQVRQLEANRAIAIGTPLVEAEPNEIKDLEGEE